MAVGTRQMVDKLSSYRPPLKSEQDVKDSHAEVHSYHRLGNRMCGPTTKNLSTFTKLFDVAHSRLMGRSWSDV